MEHDYDEYARRMNPNESPDDVVDGQAWLWRGEVEPRVESPEEREAMAGFDDANFDMALTRWLERTMAVEELTAVAARVAERITERLEEQKEAARTQGIIRKERSDKGKTRT